MGVIKKLLGYKKENDSSEDYEFWDLINQIDDAKLALDYAIQNLNNAEKSFIEAAAYEVEFRRSRFNALIKLYKEEKRKHSKSNNPYDIQLGGD